VSSRSSGSTSASSYVEPDLRKSVRIADMDVEPEQAGTYNDATTKAAREANRKKSKKEAKRNRDKEQQAIARKDEQLLYETLAKEVDNTLDDAALSRSDKALRGAIMGVLRFLASSDRPTTRAKAYELAERSVLKLLGAHRSTALSALLENWRAAGFPTRSARQDVFVLVRRDRAQGMPRVARPEAKVQGGAPEIEGPALVEPQLS
jgi:hypothetical protein